MLTLYSKPQKYKIAHSEKRVVFRARRKLSKTSKSSNERYPLKSRPPTHRQNPSAQSTSHQEQQDKLERERLDKVRKYRAKLVQFDQSTKVLMESGAFEEEDLELLYEVTNRKAFLLNEIDRLNGIISAKQWYCTHRYDREFDRYLPILRKFTTSELAKWNRELETEKNREQAVQLAAEQAKAQRILDDSDEEKMQYLLQSLRDEIGKTTRATGINRWYHQGQYIDDKQQLSFHYNADGRLKWGRLVLDVMSHFNNSYNRKFYDDS